MPSKIKIKHAKIVGIGIVLCTVGLFSLMIVDDIFPIKPDLIPESGQILVHLLVSADQNKPVRFQVTIDDQNALNYLREDKSKTCKWLHYQVLLQPGEHAFKATLNRGWEKRVFDVERETWFLISEVYITPTDPENRFMNKMINQSDNGFMCD